MQKKVYILCLKTVRKDEYYALVAACAALYSP